MVSNTFIKYFFLCLLFKFSLNRSGQLIFVYEHARHGARGPSSGFASYFKDGYDEYKIYWGTDGELSPIGKRQHYYLGVRNRLRYGKLLDFTQYNPMELLIHTTDYNRTHQSIMSELYGMYEDLREKNLTDEETKFNMVNDRYMYHSNRVLYKQIQDELKLIDKKINKINFPILNVHTFPPKRIFLVDDCIKLNNYRLLMVGDKVREFYKEFDERFSNILQDYMGQSSDYFHSYDNMKSVTDHFVCDYDNKKEKELKPLVDKGLNLEEFYDFSKRFYGHFIFNYFVDNYTSGLEETHLMQDLLGYMDRRIKYYPDTTYKAPKMVMDCGHDTTVGPIARFIANTFNVKYHEFCEFACNVYFELYHEGDGKYTVDYYLDDELLIDHMDYNEFKDTMQKHFWSDTYMDEFCGKREDTNIENSSKIEQYSNLLLAISVVSTMLFLIFITSTIVIFRRLKKLQKKFQENPLMDKDLEGSELPALT
jgi:hypothetical protein